MRHSKTILNKIETILKSQGYVIRYEKGNFKCGYCLLNDSNVIVINKFYDLRQKIDSFALLLPNLKNFREDILSEDDSEVWRSLTTKSLQLKLVA